MVSRCHMPGYCLLPGFYPSCSKITAPDQQACQIGYGEACTDQGRHALLAHALMSLLKCLKMHEQDEQEDRQHECHKRVCDLLPIPIALGLTLCTLLYTQGVLMWASQKLGPGPLLPFLGYPTARPGALITEMNSASIVCR